MAKLKIYALVFVLFGAVLLAVYQMGRLSERAQANAKIALNNDKIRKANAEWNLEWSKREAAITNKWRKSDATIRRLLAKNKTLQDCRAVDLGPDLTREYWGL